MGKFLFDRGNATWIFTFQYILDLTGQSELTLLHDFGIFDHIDGDVVVNEAQNIQIESVDITFYFENIFFTHFATLGILDNRDCAIQLVQT